MAKEKKKKSARERERERQAARQRAQRMQWIRYGGLVALLLGGLVFFGLYRQSNVIDATDLSTVVADNIDGSPDAPISIVEFGDFGCPACRSWHQSGIKQQIKANYGDQVSFTFRHLPVITPQSPKAAEAAQCAADQGQFWEYHDYLYEVGTDLRPASLKSYAAVLGLDTVAFNNCLDDNKYRQYVIQEARSADAAGALGTPTFLVNGIRVAIPSYAGLSEIIDAELAQ